MNVLVVAITVLGLAVGSFLNVVICRVPLRESVSRPPSRCPSCQHRIRPRHNIPVIGWLLLRGRCADCGVPISGRYPAVELITGALFAAVTLQAVHLDLVAALPAFLYFAGAGICLTAIDIDVRRLPNAIVLPAYPVLAVLLTIAAIVRHDPAALARAAVGAASLFAFYYAAAFAYPGGMGSGDVKLAGILGGVLGFISYPALVVGAFAAFLIGATVGIVVMLSRRGGRKSAIPFGPFMIAGAMLAFFASSQLAVAYLHLVAPA